MRIAYLMAVHKEPELLRRAIATLRCDGAEFFVHVDSKSDHQRFAPVWADDVFPSLCRFPVHWGEFSLVRVAQVLTEQALLRPIPPDYLVFLTGSTYPLRSGRYVRAFFERNRGAEFISVVRMPAPGKPIARINIVRYPNHMRVHHFTPRTLAKFGLARRDYRKYLQGLEPFAGVAAWALSRPACEYLLEFAVRNPRIVRFFENTFAPDEMFFHTILGNSQFKLRLTRDLLYDRWPAPGPHPADISDEDMSFFEASDEVRVSDMYGSGEVLFARKFYDSRLHLVDRVDQMILRKEHCAPTRGDGLAVNPQPLVPAKLRKP
jgi:hypothetical protein